MQLNESDLKIEYVDPLNWPAYGDLLWDTNINKNKLQNLDINKEVVYNSPMESVYINKYGNIKVMIFVMFIGSLINCLVTVIWGSTLQTSFNLEQHEIIAFLMLVIPGGVLMMFCWGKALQLISPTQAAISLGFNPLSAILLGYLILNEPVTFRLAIGFISIIFAILLANWKLNKK